MGKARKGLRSGPNPQKLEAREFARRALDVAAGSEKKLIGFIQAFQQNLNQLYRNERVISDMAYTNNVHVTVLREVMFEKGLLTKEEYEQKINHELEVRAAIQNKQEEEAAQAAEELRKKQSEEAAATSAAETPAVSSKPEEPKVFGGDFRSEGVDGQATQGEQGHNEDQVSSLQE